MPNVDTTNAKRAIHTSLKKVKSGSEATDWTIGHLTSIGEIGIESEEIDVTDLDSTEDFKEYIAGTKDAGEVALAGNTRDESVITKMYALANSRAIESWIVTYPSGATWEFTAFVKSFKDTEKTPDGIISWTASLRISGKPVFTAAS